MLTINLSKLQKHKGQYYINKNNESNEIMNEGGTLDLWYILN